MAVSSIRVGPFETDHLVGQRTVPAQQDGPGRCQQERPVVVGEMVAAHDVHTAVARMAVVPERRLARRTRPSSPSWRLST